MELRPAHLDAAFDEVWRRYGSFGAFLARGLDLDDQTLRQLRDALAGWSQPGPFGMMNFTYAGPG